MIHFTPYLATVQMLDTTRGDLFAVISVSRHFVVQVDSPLQDAEKTVGAFAPGQIGLDERDQPVLIALHPNATFTPCRALPLMTTCPHCGGVMHDNGDDVFVCDECGEKL